MVARTGDFSTSFSAGEFSQELAGRIDLKQYYSAGLKVRGFEPVPQAGLRQLPGSRLKAMCRKPLVDIEGATAAGLSAWSISGAGATVTEIAFAEQRVSAVQITNFAASAAGTLAVDYLDGETWALWIAFTVTTTARTRTALWPPQKGVDTTGIRLRFIPTSPATVSIGSVAVLAEDMNAGNLWPLFYEIPTDAETSYMLAVSVGVIDAYLNGAFVGGALAPFVTADNIGALDFYGEANTFGVFHPRLKTKRLQVWEASHEWAVDDWPYDAIPDVDYGGSYTKTDDVWQVYVKWAENVLLSIALTVDGETTEAVSLGPDIMISAATAADWDAWAAAVQAALSALPSMSGGTITVTQEAIAGARRLTITFGGTLSGAEYDLTADIVNTSSASALPVHQEIGDTAGEPFISTLRGWPATMAIHQDRAVYGGVPSKPSATLMSEVGEYFQLNIKREKDSAARLDAIRSQATETIRKIIDTKYLIIFTDRTAYFVPNRELSRNTPVNYVKTGSQNIGIAAGTDVAEIDNFIFYVGASGDVVYSAQYDDVSTSYNSNPQSLLASHLVSGIVRTAAQGPFAATNASRFWMLRDDGRLIVCPIIVSQDILGFCEWLCAEGGLVKAVRVDSENQVWIAIERNGIGTIEVLEEGLLLQSAVTATIDVPTFAGLDHLEGKPVWAVDAAGYVQGPMTVRGGAVTLQWPGVWTVGAWVAPIAETMPSVLVVGENRVVRRPGRIHTVHLAVIDTTSLAVGANGETPYDVPLARVTDPLDQPTPARTERLTIDGLDGVIDDPTLVITQVRPGRLRLRDVTVEAKL